MKVWLDSIRSYGVLMKKCSVCKEHKELSYFYNSAATKDGKGYRCKPCDKKARNKWNENNHERASYLARNNRLKFVYGVDIRWYEQKLKEQEGACAICGTDKNKTAGKRAVWNFAVDHNHDTGEIRGLLCNTCNRALGLFKDNVNVLSKAIDYLKSYDTH